MNKEQKLLSLREDMKIVGGYLQEIALAMLENNISKYPLFIAHHESAINLGKAVIVAEKSRTHWSFNASMLEELVVKKLFDKDKISDFVETLGDPTQNTCIFMATPDEMNFIFVPFEVDEENDDGDEATDDVQYFSDN
ncbi:MAG: hypothetical protein R2798_13405 [Chitinophagales bacterium]|nr:hypothetical protein [Bacteroidota bacterium]MCB9044248.1 hypothetical protein [Chitinophagales bacterium]